jgi:putative transposase
VGGYCYHVIDRGNRRAEVFHHEGDYHAFVRLLRQACARVPLRVLAYCLMPNHFHLVVWPVADGHLARWMDWLLTTHVRRYHRQYGTSGHVWQGRFRAFPIEQDMHLLTVLRYVERNGLRANLAARAEDWPWSSLAEWVNPPALPWLDPGPVGRGTDWVPWVNEPHTEAELVRLRRSVQRGTPYGSTTWTQAAAAALGLQFTLRPRGRPPGSGRGPGPMEPGLFG